MKVIAISPLLLFVGTGKCETTQLWMSLVRVDVTFTPQRTIHHGNERSKTSISRSPKNKSADAFEILYGPALPYFQIDSSHNIWSHFVEFGARGFSTSRRKCCSLTPGAQTSPLDLMVKTGQHQSQIEKPTISLPFQNTFYGRGILACRSIAPLFFYETTSSLPSRSEIDFRVFA